MALGVVREKELGSIINRYVTPIRGIRVCGRSNSVHPLLGQFLALAMLRPHYSQSWRAPTKFGSLTGCWRRQAIGIFDADPPSPESNLQPMGGTVIRKPET
jgi:hypothetical protein